MANWSGCCPASCRKASIEGVCHWSGSGSPEAHPNAAHRKPSAIARRAVSRANWPNHSAFVRSGSLSVSIQTMLGSSSGGICSYVPPNEAGRPVPLVIHRGVRCLRSGKPAHGARRFPCLILGRGIKVPRCQPF